MKPTHSNPDNDLHKGAVEDDAKEENTSLRGQLGHRNQDDMMKDNDSDYPEPGSSPEHSGQDKISDHGQHDATAKQFIERQKADTCGKKDGSQAA